MSVHLAESSNGPPVMDTQNPDVKLIIKGREVSGCKIDGGSGVNVLSETTCRSLDLTQWGPCPFWLHMADTHSIQPLDLI